MKDVFRCYYPPVDKDQYTFLLVDVLKKKNAGNLILVLIKLIVTVCSDHYCRFFFIIVEGMDYNRVPACSLAKLVHKNITIDQVTEHTFGEGGIRLKYIAYKFIRLLTMIITIYIILFHFSHLFTEYHP